MVNCKVLCAELVISQDLKWQLWDILLKTFLAKQQYIGVRNVKHHCALPHVLSFITQLLTFLECIYRADSLVIHMNEEFMET